MTDPISCVFDEDSKASEMRHLLSPTEREILKGTADGLTLKEIGNNLNMTVRQVEVIRGNRMSTFAKQYVGAKRPDIQCLTRFAVGIGLVPLTTRHSIAIEDGD